MKKAALLTLLIVIVSPRVWAESKPLPPVIDNSTYFGGDAAKTAAPSNNAIYEVLGRLEQLQLEVQQLRGLVEEQAHVIENLENRQSQIYTDLDQRLMNLTQRATGNQPAGFENDAAEPSSAAVYEKPPEKTDQTVVQTEVSAVPAVNEKQLYTDAYETLRNGHNSQAIAAFKSLLEQFPSGEFADNAQYWLGEAYKVNQDTQAATQAFSRVVELYPNSPKVPDALLKLGYIELEKNNKAQARDYLTRIVTTYPSTTAAHLAEKKLEQMAHQ